MQLHPHFIWKDLFQNRKSHKGSLVEILRENVLFQTLSERELNLLAKVVYERVYQADEPVFHQNERGFGVYIIAKGRVEIRTEALEENVQITCLGAGSFFGELSLIEPDNIRSASALACERTILIGFFKPDLMEILERQPTMGVKILFQLSAVLGQRLLKTTEKNSELTNQSKAKKIHEDAI